MTIYRCKAAAAAAREKSGRQLKDGPPATARHGEAKTEKQETHENTLETL
eukprot:CAMPEP_0172533432 /NCGR_PEP_ID=MMETSP1067-20121228/6143_1 /TAXON_ID=265564 ORGANISM="Thalassiosira punctigera, Strain Tpunct2005C2" /NCGR_SAMPLE_ID=MMETSP1067 /ASSEMBLY_ACC=CAM_ASM_000444 /LENGTH=49 /DNA_ID= /DNA_START= /DNA_END= /DNA_ORIENTATION=